jgi:hypothetical protein
MSLELMKYSILDYPLIFTFYFVILAVVASIGIMIIHRRHRAESLRNLDAVIDCIPFLAGLIPVTGFLREVYSLSKAISLLATSGTGAPQVIAAGFSDVFCFSAMTVGLFFILLEVWLVIRMVYGRYLHELDTHPI